LLAVYGFSIVEIVKDNPKEKTIHFGGIEGQANATTEDLEVETSALETIAAEDPTPIEAEPVAEKIPPVVAEESTQVESSSKPPEVSPNSEDISLTDVDVHSDSSQVAESILADREPTTVIAEEETQIPPISVPVSEEPTGLGVDRIAHAIEVPVEIVAESALAAESTDYFGEESTAVNAQESILPAVFSPRTWFLKPKSRPSCPRLRRT